MSRIFGNIASAVRSTISAAASAVVSTLFSYIYNPDLEIDEEEPDEPEPPMPGPEPEPPGPPPLPPVPPLPIDDDPEYSREQRGMRRYSAEQIAEFIDFTANEPDYNRVILFMNDILANMYNVAISRSLALAIYNRVIIELRAPNETKTLLAFYSWEEYIQRASPFLNEDPKIYKQLSVGYFDSFLILCQLVDLFEEDVQESKSSKHQDGIKISDGTKWVLKKDVKWDLIQVLVVNKKKLAHKRLRANGSVHAYQGIFVYEDPSRPVRFTKDAYGATVFDPIASGRPLHMVTLDRYQIYRRKLNKNQVAHDEYLVESRKDIDVHCFIYALMKALEGDEERQNILISLSQLSGMDADVSTNQFIEFCNELNVRIHVRTINSRGCDVLDKNQYNPTSPDESTVTVVVAKHRKHLFAYDVLEGIPQSLRDQGVKGIRGSHSKISSLQLIHAYERFGYIDMSYEHTADVVNACDENSIQTEEDPKSLLKTMDYDQRPFKSNKKYKNQDRLPPMIFASDTETIKYKGEELCISIGWIDRNMHTDSYQRFINWDLNTNVAMVMMNNMVDQADAYNNLRDVPPRNRNRLIIVEYHNLRFDIAVLQRMGLRVTSQLMKDATVYCATTRHRGYDFKFVDTLKKVPLPLAKACKAFATKHCKKEVIAYRYYCEENLSLNGIQEHCTIDKYLTYMDNGWHSMIDFSVIGITARNKRHMVKVLTEDLEGPNLFKYNPNKGTFDPWAYYFYYMEHDCRALKDVMNKFDSIVYEQFNGLDANEYLTIGAIQRAAAEQAGCFKGVWEYRGGLRKYLSLFVTGGKVYAPPHHARKRHGKDFVWEEHEEIGPTGLWQMSKARITKGFVAALDGISLYPSAILKLLLDGYGSILGKCRLMDVANITAEKLASYSYYNVEICITKVNKHCEVPKICERRDGKLNYINRVPYANVFVDKIGLEELIKYHDIEYTIVSGVYWSDGFSNAGAAFTDKLYTMRAKAKKEKNPGLSEVLKLFLNSYYGKHIPSQHTTRTVIIDRYTPGYVMKCIEAGTECVRDDNVLAYVYNHCNLVTQVEIINEQQARITLKQIDTGYATMQEGIMILSASKRLMNEVFAVLEVLHVPMFYTDTDSMHIYSECIPAVADKYKQVYGRELIGESLMQFHSDFALGYIDENGDEQSASDVKAYSSIVFDRKVYCDGLVGKRPKMVYSEEAQKYINTKELLDVNGYHIRCKGVNGAAVSYKAAKEHNGDVLALYDRMCGEKVEFNNVIPEGKPVFKIQRFGGVYKKDTDTKTIGYDAVSCNTVCIDPNGPDTYDEYKD